MGNSKISTEVNGKMKHFIRSVFCAGFGGQGVMVLGQMIAYAGMHEGRYVTWLPSYVPRCAAVPPIAASSSATPK